MLLSQVKWELYTNELAGLSEYCKAGQGIWRARVPMICLDVVEWHYPDRVLRQFGMTQTMPLPTVRGNKIHTLSRWGHAQSDWTFQHRGAVDTWTNKHALVAPGYEHNDVNTMTNDYLAWYECITRRWIEKAVAHAL